MLMFSKLLLMNLSKLSYFGENPVLFTMDRPIHFHAKVGGGLGFSIDALGDTISYQPAHSSLFNKNN